MIEFKNLSKIYESRHGKPCVALNNINLKLPDTGLIFIIGKSGSGKSTLLNLLGGLDTITNGDIIADGNSLASFDSSDFDSYRSSYIGFVFQHYYLLEELTIAENVALAMNIVGKDDPDEVTRLLAEVGLSGYENRYPRELSGGQQQRVAIARALAKNPQLILGDELTGNLDHKTSVEILNVLKSISKEKLVVVVSHNISEADMFADRIIELQDGEILRDRVRVSDKQKRFEITDGVAYLPYFRDLTQKETLELEQGLRDGSISSIVQLDDGFANIEDNVNSTRQTKLSSAVFLQKAKNKYTKTYALKGLASKLITIMIATLMLLCVTVFTSLHITTHADVSYGDDTPFVPVIKSSMDAVEGGLFATWYYSVTEDDYRAAAEALGGKIYKLVNPSIVASKNQSNLSLSLQQADLKVDLKLFYTTQSRGTLICDPEFLINTYGVNGELQVLAGEIPYDSPKMIITDYLADSLIFYSNDIYHTYQDVVDGEPGVAAIIETGYESRYSSLLEYYPNGSNTSNPDAIFNELSSTELHQKFQREYIYSLGITYSFNPNFEEDYLNEYTCSSVHIYRFTAVKDGREYNFPSLINSFDIERNDYESTDPEYSTVNKGEMKLSFTQYNMLFSTNYTVQSSANFVPHDVTFRIYDKPSGDRNLIYENTFTIVDITNTGRMHEDDFEELRKFSIVTYGLYLENNQNLDSTLSVLNDRDFAPRSITTAAIAGINKMLSIFIPLFTIITIGMYAFIVVQLISFAISNIKKNYFRIGVMRSFGAKNSDVGVIFITGIVIMGFAIIALMLLFETTISGLYNRLLIESFSLVLDTYAHDLCVVQISPNTLLFNSLLVIAITLVSALVSIFMLHNLKPIEIIRAKDNGGEVS